MDLSRMEEQSLGTPVRGSSSGGRGSASSNLLIPDLLQLYRQTLFMATKEAELSVTGSQFGQGGLDEMSAALDNWANVEFDPPGCLRLSKKSGACQKIVSYWKKLLGSILKERDPASFGNHDRGVMTICKLLHKDFQVAVTAISRWNDRDFPNIPPEQAKEKLSMNQLTFLCRRYHNDLTLIAHAFKSSLSANDFKYLNPRLTETYPITEGPEYVKEEHPGPHVSPAKADSSKKKKGKAEKRPSPSSRAANDSMVSMASMFGPLDVDNHSPRVNYVSEFMSNSPLPSPISIDSKAFPFQSQAHPPPKKIELKAENQSILKSLLPAQSRQGLEQPLDLGRGQGGKMTGANGSSSGMNGHRRMSSRGDGDQYGGEVQKLKAKNKKYVGMIMQLVHQLFSVGQVPFVDLTGIDQEDRDESSAVSSSTPSSRVSHGPYNGTLHPSQQNGHGRPSHQSASPNSASLMAAQQATQAAKRPRSTAVPARMRTPQVSFDRTTMSWHSPSPRLKEESPDSPSLLPIKRSVPTGPNSALQTLLTSKSPSPSPYKPSVIQHSNGIDMNGAMNGLNGNFTQKSNKRKSNPIKRELPGYGPIGATSSCSPEPGLNGAATPSDADSHEDDDLAKNVKSSLFVPPVELNYVESRMGNGLIKRPIDDILEQMGVNKRKCSNMQAMADSLLYANDGLATLGTAINTASVPPPKTLVFAKLQEGVMFPGEVVERTGSGCVVAWLHDNFSSYISAGDVMMLSEALTQNSKTSLMVRLRNGQTFDYYACNLLEANRDGSYKVFTHRGDSTRGDSIRCPLEDLIVVMDANAPLVLDGDIGSKRQMELLASRSPVPESVVMKKGGSRIVSQATVSSVDDTDIFRGVCFTVTWQKSRAEDEQMITLIQSAGGVVADSISDLISFAGEKVLVASCTCSTSIYFQCLAADIPCVSYQWVIDSYTAKEKREYGPYLLPAGFEDDQVILWHPRENMFGDRRISLYGEDAPSVASWYLALKAGGVAVTTLDIEHMTEEMANVDIVVALESSCPHSIRDAAEAEGGVTIVSDNWLKSSLIHGKLQDWDKAEYMPSFD
ncbi:hypothetical protein RvY_04620-2 [Ramazzottius varieornatus]|uniref:BRCT domain-containing protein n=1 Tax=Ramazzottius varieornatus TaxID=947166 RepID=A0A1D1US91_RAMVA|nr:hypothetical protein RvY_04620-2 [Ramazzottius varieornatus]